MVLITHTKLNIIANFKIKYKTNIMGISFLNCIIKRCEWCDTSEWGLEEPNYILKFYGKGKYNGHYMCMDCLNDKLSKK